MSTKVHSMNVHCAGNPTFFPGDRPESHHTTITVIDNDKGRDNKEYQTEYTLKFWGKYAQAAAQYLKKGRCLSFEGVLTSYTKDTGQVNTGTGKRILNRKNEVRVTKFAFGPATKAELQERVNGNIAKLVMAGRLVAGSVSAEELLAIDVQPSQDYNPMLAAQTGMYGNAKVWNKASGSMMVPGQAAPVNIPANPAGVVAPNGVAITPELLQAAQLLAANMTPTAPAANVANNAPVDAFGITG